MRDALRRVLRRSDAGFTLVEVMVACVLLGILSAAVIGVILQTQSQSVTNRARIAASNLAARESDLVRDEFHRTKTAPLDIANAGTVTNPHPLDGQTAGQPLVVDGTPFTVTRSVQWNITGNGQSACDGGSLLVYPTLGVTVSVTWPNMGSVKPVVSTSALAPDKGSGVPAEHSFIAVRVNDQDGHVTVGRSVQVSGGSETKTGSTDASGCAVLEVSPAAGVGTSYTAQVIDPGYVDVSSSGTSDHPTKSVGLVSQGQLNNNVTFQVAKGGTAFVHLKDSNGNVVTTAPSGASLTLDAVEHSGSASGTPYPIAGAVTEIDNLWPTNYGAYYGSTPPDGGFVRKDLAPGGTIELDAVIQLANTTVTDLPDGTVVKAVAGSATTCTGATTLGTVSGGVPLAVSVPPGEWTFFATFPYAACSPGPDVVLVPGTNGAVTWGLSTLNVSGNPFGSTVYVADSSMVTNATPCPPAVQAGSAQTVTGGTISLPAGTWYVWAVNGASCVKPNGAASVVLPFAGTLNLVWGNHATQVTITGIEALTGSTMPRVYLSSTATIGAGGLTCSASGVTSTTATVINLGTPTGSTSPNNRLTPTVSEGTWYIVGNDTRASGAGRWSPACRIAGRIVVGPYSGALSIDYNATTSWSTTNPNPTVGP